MVGPSRCRRAGDRPAGRTSVAPGGAYAVLEGTCEPPRRDSATMTTRRTSATASATASSWRPGLRAVPRALPNADGFGGC
eukprot:14219433-Heterocapsa_arctica.AAC.1